MWPKLLDMSKDECKRLLRRTELEAYAGVISAFRAQGDITKDKKHILNELAACLSISTERHRAEVRRAVNDEKLSTVAERLSGANNSAEWSIEGRRLIPLMPRLVPQTVFSLTANQAANAAFSHNLTLPLPSETAKKEVPCGSENNGSSVRLAASPSSSVVVLPSVLSIPTKGSPDVDTEGPAIKRSSHDSNNSHLKDAGPSSVAAHASPSSLPSNLLNVSTKPSTAHGHAMAAANRSMSLPAGKHHSGYTLPASKQHVGKPVISRMSPVGQSMTSAAIKASLGSGQSPLKFTYTKASKSAGITTPTCSAQKVILVSNSATSFTPSILQRSHSAPSPKSPQGKPGTKQSVILTGMSGGQSRQAEVVSSGKHTSPLQRQHATSAQSSNRQTVSGRQQLEMTSGQMIPPPDTMQGAMTGVMTGGKRQSLNTGISTMNSTVITARTTASVITSQMTTYVSTNMAGKPRGRAVSKQKLLKQVNATPIGGASTLPSGDSTAVKKIPGIRGQPDAGMKLISQTLAASGNKQQRSSNQTVTTETAHKAAMATATVATGKPTNVMAGHKVIISTTSAGVAPHHVTMATPLIRTKPSGSSMGSMGTVASKMMTSGALNVGGVTKIVPSGTMGSTGVNSPKMMQTIKATTTANVGQTVTGVTQIINSKPSLVMHKTLSSSAQGGFAEASKPTQAHNIASSLLQRPRISMVTGGATSPVASNFPSSSIRFPSPQNTSSITMTTVKSSGSKRMRSPVTMVTGTVPSVQRRQVPSQNPLHGTVLPGTGEELPTGKQVKDNSRSLTRGLLGSCSHPNSEWIDYDGHCPDSSASSAIKALLEFRSHPDAAKHSQTIDLCHIGTSATAKPVAMASQAATVCTTAPSKLSQHALLTSRLSHPPSEHPPVGSQLEGLSNYPPALLSNMQSRLKQALMTDRTAKPGAAASFLQTATMEVEKALQEQNKALLAKHEGSVKLTGPKSSLDGGSKLSGPPSEMTAPPKKVQTEMIKPQHVTVLEDQGVVVGKVNVSSEVVSSFVDQFEKFLESEGTVGGQKQTDRSFESVHTGQSVASHQLPARMVATTKSTAGPAEGIGASDWTVGASSQRVGSELMIPSWKTKAGLETIVTPGKKGAASVVMESGSIDITQMKIEDFTSQRLQDVDDLEEDKDTSTTSPESSPVKAMGESPGTTASTVSAPGSEESQGVRISNRKRKAPAPIDEEPGPTSMSSWARAAFNLLQRVMRFRGANRSKGDLNAASWFTRPVAAAEAPGYNRVIKNPMDFGSIKRKLESGQYDDFAGFHSDMMLVHSNCMQYNPPGHEIRRDCDEVFQFYTSEYDKLIERWERQPSPKKLKSEDLHGDRVTKPAAARTIIMK